MSDDLIDRAGDHESAGDSWAYQAMRNGCPPRKRRKYLAEAANHFTIAVALRGIAARQK